MEFIFALYSVNDNWYQYPRQRMGGLAYHIGFKHTVCIDSKTKHHNSESADLLENLENPRNWEMLFKAEKYPWI